MGLRLPQYDKMRQQTQQRFNAQGQEQQGALARRQASLGNLKSGAAIKMQQKAASDLAQQQEAAMGNIDVQEAGELQRQADIKQGQEFAATEAQKGRDFAASESALARRMQEDQFGKSFGLQERAFGSQEKQNEFMNRIAQEEHDLSKQNTEFNRLKAFSEMSPDAIADTALKLDLQDNPIYEKYIYDVYRRREAQRDAANAKKAQQRKADENVSILYRRR